jgi:hypothetical protein
MPEDQRRERRRFGDVVDADVVEPGAGQPRARVSAHHSFLPGRRTTRPYRPSRYGRTWPTAHLTAERFAKAPNLKLVITAGNGSDHVDLQTAIERGVTVAEATDSNSISVSEHVVMMILALVRNEILECWLDQRPIREEYLIVDGGHLAGAGAHSYSEGDATGGSDEGVSARIR